MPLDYHEATKHHFNRFARSRGYLDWATQPDPFRRYAGAPPDLASARRSAPRAIRRADRPRRGAPLHLDSIAEFLRCSMGLSAWKAYRETRWALRVNPSSGNLHPTEAYIVRDGRILHYAPREHALEERAVDAVRPRGRHSSAASDGFLVALTSIHWREAWKYGERAFRYCQHDVGHAIAALRVSAALFGWTLRLLPDGRTTTSRRCSASTETTTVGMPSAKRPECLALVGPSVSWTSWQIAPRLVAAARQRDVAGTSERPESRSRRVGDHRRGSLRRLTTLVNSQLPSSQLPTPIPNAWESGRLEVGSSRER